MKLQRTRINRPQRKKPKVDDPADWFSVNETMRYMHRSRPLVYDLIREGRIESFLLMRHPDSKGGRRLVRRASVEEFMEKEFLAQQGKEMLGHINVRRVVKRPPLPLKKREVVA